MNYVGVDLHKKIITVCVMDQDLKVICRRNLYPSEPARIVESLESLRSFKLTVEATAGSAWFVEMVRPLAEEVVLANPAKLRVIAESIKKTDRADAQVLAEFLARGMIPRAYLPTARQREHRALVRHRQYLRGWSTAGRCKIRHVLADSNADRKELFSAHWGKAYVKGLALRPAERHVLADLWSEWESLQKRLQKMAARIKAFVAKAPKAEAAARALLKTAPGVGAVTAEVVLSELAYRLDGDPVRDGPDRPKPMAKGMCGSPTTRI
jgi:transposase